MFDQIQKFVDMYEQFQIFLDMLKQLKKFLDFQPHAMSSSSDKSFASSFSKWILDLGATHYMSYLMSQFISLNLNSSKSIVAANGDSMPLAGTGSVDTHFVALSVVYYIPSLTMNLASVSKICDSGCDVNFSVSDCSIYDRKTQKVVGTGHKQGDLYVLDHFRDIHGTASSSVDFGCKLAKFSALPFRDSVSSPNVPFDLVHSDVWGPSPVSTKGDSRYYVSFIDDFTRYTWVYLMKRMSDFLAVYKEFRALVKTQHSTVIKCFRCDLGVNTLPMNSLDYLNQMGQYIRPLARTLLNKMVLLKRSIVILLRQLDPFCCQLMFQVYFGEKCSHNLTQSELIKIDPFEDLTPVMSPIIPDTIFETTPDIPQQPTITTGTPPVTIIEATSTVNQPLPRLPNNCLNSFASFVSSVHSLHEPESYTEAVYDPLWQGAMAEELTALH
ncbi:gag-pol polyprotein [Tanacetum coccineum]